MGIFSLTQELAVDLGTANTLIIHNGKVVVDEPSIIAVDIHTGKVVAIGKERFVTADMIKPGAVVIDVGVNRDSRTGKLCGDVDFEPSQEVAGYITPVPGGVGPMTIACLMEHTVESFKRKVTK